MGKKFGKFINIEVATANVMWNLIDWYNNEDRHKKNSSWNDNKQNVVLFRQNCQKRHFHAQINSEEQN